MSEIKVKQSNKNKLRNTIRKRKDNRWFTLFEKIFIGVARIVLFPILLIVKIYSWVYDYDYMKFFK